MGKALEFDLRLAPARLDVERRADGATLLRSPQSLGGHARAVGEWLVRWAREAPARTFLAERQGDAWRKIGYREALALARRVGQGLLARGLDASRPLVILSDNSIDHALLALGAMHVGIPFAPVSPAYSLMSKDFAKLKAIFGLLRPGLVWTADPAKFAPALAAVGASATPIAELLAHDPGPEVDRAFEAIRPDTTAKILFTSGSTGMPKGVVNTHRMLTVNQEQYALVWPFLERDEALRTSFFRDLEFVFYAAAALPQNLWDRIKKLARQENRAELAMLSAWGSTETSPLATSVHFRMERPGVIGLPVPECDLKLVPSAGKLEVRVRGPNVMQGYYKRPELTAAAFDEEGYYRIGDAVKLADPADAAKGIVFDGRVAEDFKLSTGTWVHVGSIRMKLIAAGDPLIQDAVITGHDRNEIGALVFLSPAAKNLSAEELKNGLSKALKILSSEPGRSTHPTRLMVMSEPPSIDANEITDKGYMNQRAVLERRAALVEKLYSAGEKVLSA